MQLTKGGDDCLASGSEITLVADSTSECLDWNAKVGILDAQRCLSGFCTYVSREIHGETNV